MIEPLVWMLAAIEHIDRGAAGELEAEWSEPKDEGFLTLRISVRRYVKPTFDARPGAD